MAGTQTSTAGARSTTAGPSAVAKSPGAAGWPVAFRGGSLDFTIPEGRVLLDQQRQYLVPMPMFVGNGVVVPNVRLVSITVASIRTDADTTVTLKLTQDKIDLSFSPPLRVDVVHKWSWVSISGISYEFGDPKTKSVGQIKPRLAVEKMLGLVKVPAVPDWTRRKIEQEIQAWFKNAIQGTDYATPGYNPMQAADPVQGLKQLAANLRQGSSTAKTNTDDTLAGVGSLRGTLEIATTTEVKQGTASADIYIPAGASVKVSVVVNSWANVKTMWIPYVDIESTAVYARSRGKNAMILNRIRIGRGGDVSILSYTPLNEVKATVAKAGPVESGLRLLALLFALNDAPRSELPGIRKSDRDLGEILAPRTVTGAPASLAGDALTKAFKDFYRQNRSAIVQSLPTGVNLDEILGMRT